MKRKLVIACMYSGLILLATQWLNAQSPNPMALVGSWQLTFTPNSSAVASPFPGLATFTSDGSVVETDGTEIIPMAVTPPVFSSPGHGIWQPGPAVSQLFVQFVSLMVNKNATLHAKKTVTITGGLDSSGNNFRGGYSFELADPAGRVIKTGSGSLTGEKIPHPALP